MKFIRLIPVIVSLCIWADIAAAGQSNSQSQASTYVSGSCRFNSSALTLSFGELDPTSAAPATATVTTQFWCTKGTAATLLSNGGLHNNGKNRMKHATAAEYIPYTLILTAPSQASPGKNIARVLSINGSIANSDYVNARVGNYSDTVEIRITP